MNGIVTFRGKDFYQGLFDVFVLGMDGHALAEVLFGAVLADVGMIGLVEDEWEIPVPELSDAARAEVRLHPARSAASAALIPLLDQVGILIRHHHEW